MDDILGSLEQLSASSFEVVNLTPAITNLSLSAGIPGTVLTISGDNFSGAAGHISVFFGSTAAAAPEVQSDSQISVHTFHQARDSGDHSSVGP